MPRQVLTTVENNFQRGLITETTGLNFPENACIETWDCVFDERGAVSRRLGFDYEESYTLFSTTRSTSAITEFEWKSVAGDGNTTFLVIQIGGTLHFYALTGTGAISDNKKSFTQALSSFQITGAPSPNGTQCQFDVGNGYLFVCHPSCDPFYISYSASGNSITATRITVQIRDTVGLTTDTFDVDYRPTSAEQTDIHKYNLYNQGWFVTGVPRQGDKTSVTPYNEFFTGLSRYPSNSDVWWLFKDANEELDIAGGNALGKGIKRTSPAPKGHYILDAFNQDRSDASGITGLAAVTSGNKRPKCITFFAGRAFYGGVDATGFNSRIYFSRVIRDDSHFGMCYSINDPTSEYTPDLLANDGGEIVVPGIGSLLRMIAMDNNLLLFASNGIWAITGSEGIGFTATDYTIKPVSGLEILSASSFVEIGGMITWWGRDGIYALKGDEVGSFKIENLTEKTIDNDFFEDISPTSKETAKGDYNPQTKTIRWLYKSSAGATTDTRYNYDRVLSLNVVTGAFYPWTIDTSVGPTINGVIAVKGSGTDIQEVTVVDNNGATVVDTAAETVTVDEAVTVQRAAEFFYVTTKNTSGSSYQLTFSQTRDTTYVDWETAGTGVSYESYFITGYKVRGEASRKFNSNYITVFMETETGASCYIQGLWNYSNSSSSGKWSSEQQVYRTKTLRDVQQARIKMRGSGRAVQFKFRSEESCPMTIIGWSTWETVNATI